MKRTKMKKVHIDHFACPTCGKPRTRAEVIAELKKNGFKNLAKVMKLVWSDSDL